jgi:bacteriocin-like protein
MNNMETLYFEELNTTEMLQVSGGHNGIAYSLGYGVGMGLKVIGVITLFL